MLLLHQFFFKENVWYQVWTCRDPISTWLLCTGPMRGGNKRYVIPGPGRMKVLMLIFSVIKPKIDGRLLRLQDRKTSGSNIGVPNLLLAPGPM